jgi:AFG3 family protein
MPPKKKKKESASTTNNNKVDEDHETTDGERGSATRDRRTGFGSKNNNKKRKSNSHNSNHNNGDQQPPQEQVGAMLAFLLLFLAFRSIQESDVKNGSEITWHDFRTHLINDTKKLVVVNKNLVRVHLKEGARGMPTTNSGTTLYESQALSSPTAVQVGSEDWNDGTEMDLGSSSIDANDASDHQLQHRRDNNHHVYHFFIGSVDTFEEKLTNAQQEAGVQPRDYISVNYVTETGLGKGNNQSQPLDVHHGIVYLGTTSKWQRRSGRPGRRHFSNWKVQCQKDKQGRCQCHLCRCCGVSRSEEGNYGICRFSARLHAGSPNWVPRSLRVRCCADHQELERHCLAKAVAGEAGVPFYSISGSDFIGNVRRCWTVQSARFVQGSSCQCTLYHLH